MRALNLTACCLVFGLLAPAAILAQSRATARPVVYEGARLISGDERAPIENGAFVVANGRITAIGAKGRVSVPSGARRVDLTGKTVIPAFVNVHAHIGYETYTNPGGESRPEFFTPENVLDHLQRQAFYGVGTVNDAGSAPLPPSIEFIRDVEGGKYPPAARLNLMAGVVPVNGGPDHVLIEGTRPLNANYEVTLSPQARAAVQDIAKKGVKHLKIWIGDRGGTYPAMPHETYDAVIDEAHKLGIKVHAHASSNRDQADVLRAGADVLVHAVGNDKLSDQLIALIKEKKPYWTPVMGLLDPSELCEPGNTFVEQAHSPEMIAEFRTHPRPEGAYLYPILAGCPRDSNMKLSGLVRNPALLKQNFMTMIQSGARLVLGTDAGVFPKYTFGSADHHELEKYVTLGLTPAQAIVAATSRAAELLGLPDVGLLATGKQADFVVLTANPLENIRNTRTIDSVYLRGEKVDRAAMLAKWRPAAAKSTQ
jgi:imidazolonepropionase-like amidohydrolase